MSNREMKEEETPKDQEVLEKWIPNPAVPEAAELVSMLNFKN